MRNAIENAMKEAAMDNVTNATVELGRPCWVDLRSPDPQSAATFYGALFGWEFVESAASGGGHRTALLQGLPVAGLGPTGGSGRPGWTTYFSVADADRAAGVVTAAGGTVLLPPADCRTGGAEAVFSDPGGARFGVRQAGGDQAAGAAGPAGRPGTCSWGELITDDVDSSVSFYRSVFGWTASGPEGPLHRRAWELHGRPVSGLLPRPPAMPEDIPPYWDVYFTVADAAGTSASAIAAGGTRLMAPTDIGTGHIAVFMDPAGAVFTVIAPTVVAPTVTAPR